MGARSDGYFEDPGGSELIDQKLIRPMTASDIHRGLELCRAANWNQLRGDWDYLIAHARCYVAVLDDRVEGTCAILQPDGPLAWIAMMLVDPAVRRRSIGSGLFEHVVGIAKAPSIGLDATGEGRLLYARYGFEPVCEIERWHRGTGAWTTIPERNITCPWRSGGASNQIGPLVAGSIEDAGSAVNACVAADPLSGWILDVPAAADPAWHGWLKAQGFTPQRTFTRMYRGPAPSIDSNLYATSGPEFGPLI